MKNFIKNLHVTYKEVSNILIKYYFSVEKVSKKTLLINLFGEEILKNLETNLKDTNFSFCECCGERFEKKTPNSNQIYCPTCAKKINIQKTIENRKNKLECLKRKTL